MLRSFKPVAVTSPTRSFAPPPSQRSQEIPTLSPPASKASHNPQEAASRLREDTESTDPEQMRVDLARSLLFACADPAVRLIDRAEATSISQRLREVRDGPLILQIAEFTKCNCEQIQRDLLKKQHCPLVHLEPFISPIKTARLEDYAAVLRPLGVVPVFRNDRLLTCLAEHPLVSPIVVALCRKSELPIYWCHVLTIPILSLVSLCTGEQKNFTGC